MNNGHEFEMDPKALDAWCCIHSGCTVRKSATGQFWQAKKGAKKGAKWNDIDNRPLPPCEGRR